MISICCECAYCELLAFNHPFFGESECMVCTNVLDDEVTEIPKEMRFAFHEIPCYTFVKRGEKNEKDSKTDAVIFTTD